MRKDGKKTGTKDKKWWWQKGWVTVKRLWATQSVYCASGSAINFKGDTEGVNGSLLFSICSHFPFGSAISQSDEKIIGMSFFPNFNASCHGCLTWQVCLPVLQPGPDDGFIELRNLPLQHGPQVLSEAVVVLLQLLLVLFLVRCDQMLVLLNRLPTPMVQRADNLFISLR